MGFRVSVSLYPATQATGLMAFIPVGLSPTEHTSLCWTHSRTVGFPESGSDLGSARHLSGRAFLHRAMWWCGAPYTPAL